MWQLAFSTATPRQVLCHRARSSNPTSRHGLDRLPWGRFPHACRRALGVTWILDGLEVTLAGAVAGALKQSPVLQFSSTESVWPAAPIWPVRCSARSSSAGLPTGWGARSCSSSRWRSTSTATAATALTWNLWTFCSVRFVTGAGIGGEYTAINSTIQELIPARVRGWTDLVINGSFWVGAALGAAGSIVLLDPTSVADRHGLARERSRSGRCSASSSCFLRMWIPESPRWLLTHGRAAEAEAIVADIEQSSGRQGHQLARRPVSPKSVCMLDRILPLARSRRNAVSDAPQRTVVGLSLMAAQAFFYNAIFFTYALILTDFYNVRADHVGWYILPFAAGNFLGPLLIGPLLRHLGVGR